MKNKKKFIKTELELLLMFALGMLDGTLLTWICIMLGERGIL